MAVKFGWFDIPIGGDPLKYKYSGNQMRDIWKSLLTNGIVPEIRQSTTGVIVPTKQLGASLSANVAQGLKVTINNGLAFIDGAYFFVYTPEQIPLQAGWINDIVLRLDVTGNEIVYGIFNKQRSAGTIEAGLTRQGGVYELGLHSVNIPANAEQITADMITDYRLNMGLGADGKPCCGIVGSLLMPDIDAWYKSATAEQKAWLDKSQAEFATWSSQQKADFNSWFASLKDILDENTAGNLLNLINTHKADQTVHVQTLTHTKVGTVHNLVCTIPSSGLISANFVASADGTSKDTFTLNGEAYSAQDTLGKPISGFVTGAGVSLTINVDTKILTVGGGGGGSGKMVQQLEIPVSDEYEESTPSAWSTTDVAGQPAMLNSAVDGDYIYSVARENVAGTYKIVLYTQNAVSKMFTREEYTDTGYAHILKTIRYNNETYFIGASAMSSSSATIVFFKLNRTTKTYTQIFSWTCSPYYNATTLIEHITDDIVLFIWTNSNGGSATNGMFGLYYTFSSNTVSNVTAIIQDVSYNSVLYFKGMQKDTTSNFFRTAFKYSSTGTYNGLQFSLSNKNFSVCPLGNISTTLFTTNDNFQLVQIADKMMYASTAIHFAGKRTGEIDFFKCTIDPTKYPEVPEGFQGGYCNMHLINDTVSYQIAGKFNEMQLVPVLPENMPEVMYIMEGDMYSAPFITAPINVLPINRIGQPAFTITNRPQIATRDYEIHLRQYTLNSMSTQLLIKRG